MMDSDNAGGAGEFPGARMAGQPSWRQAQMMRLKRGMKEYRWSLLFVWLPTLISVIYYLLFASDLYASEAKFIVRAPSRAPTIGLSSLLQGGGIGHAQDDVFAVQDFVVSRDAVARLEKQVDLRGIFKRPGADFLARYPNPIFTASAEDFFKYYKTRVSISYDSTTGVSTLTVKAFRPDDARHVADLLLKEGEALVNRLNERAHANAVSEAEIDVQLAESRAAEAQQNVLAYRTREALLDPGKSSGAIFETYAKLQADLAATRTRLDELNRSSPGSPLKTNLEAHASAVTSEVEALNGRLAGGEGSMAPKISEYERLILKQDFASKELASAMASLEMAREEARRQSTYLDRIVEPNEPDKAEFPKRLKTILIVLMSCCLFYWIGKLLIAGLREHSQV